MMRFARATILLSLGRLAEGWGGLRGPLLAGHERRRHFHIPGTRWSRPGHQRARTLMISTEQGLGD
ncbi:hypothetical protein ACRAWD_15715 [Caulobacter segnis]